LKRSPNYSFIIFNFNKIPVIYLTLLAEITAQNRNITIQFGFSSVPVSFGTPPQLFYMGLDFTLPNLMLIDSNCGEQDVLCPKYCSDGRFFLGFYL
jgi:hypothetical protein